MIDQLDIQVNDILKFESYSELSFWMVEKTNLRIRCIAVFRTPSYLKVGLTINQFLHKNCWSKSSMDELNTLKAKIL